MKEQIVAKIKSGKAGVDVAKISKGYTGTNDKWTELNSRCVADQSDIHVQVCSSQESYPTLHAKATPVGVY